MNEQYRYTLEILEAYRKQIEDIQKPLVDALKPIIDAQLSIQKYYSSPMIEAAKAMSSSIQSAFAPVLTEAVRDAIWNNQAIALSLSDAMANAFKHIDFSEYISEYSSSLDFDSPEDDYVTFDDTVIKELDISENIAIRVGKNRVRMKTSDFLNLLMIIVTIVFSVCSARQERLDAATSAVTTEKLIEIEQERNLIEQERNELLSTFISSIDYSETKDQELLEELNESLLNLQSEISELKDTVQVFDSTVPDSDCPSQAPELDSDNPPETTGNTNESVNTESEN